MNYSRVDGLDIPVSDIIFGCCNPVLMEDRTGADELLELAFSNGFNTFDTALVYGKSEEVLGRWLQETGYRNRVIIVTKGCHPDKTSRVNVKALREDIDSSLHRLQTDYIDIYMLHRDDKSADIKSILLELNDYLRQGVIKKIGVSNWTHKRIEEANRIATDSGLEGFTISSPQMSIARQIRDPWGGGCVSISHDKDAIAWYNTHPEITVFAYSCLGRGLFAGKTNSNHPISLYRSLDSPARRGYWCIENIRRLRVAERIAKDKGCSVAELSLSWCRSQSIAVHVIATMSNENRMQENINSLEIFLNDNDKKCLEG